MEKFIEFIQESIKTIENKELNEEQMRIVASRFDSICSLLQITLYHLNQTENEKVQ